MNIIKDQVSGFASYIIIYDTLSITKNISFLKTSLACIQESFMNNGQPYLFNFQYVWELLLSLDYISYTK